MHILHSIFTKVVPYFSSPNLLYKLFVKVVSRIQSTLLRTDKIYLWYKVIEFCFHICFTHTENLNYGGLQGMMMPILLLTNQSP